MGTLGGPHQRVTWPHLRQGGYCKHSCLERNLPTLVQSLHLNAIYTAFVLSFWPQPYCVRSVSEFPCLLFDLPLLHISLPTRSCTDHTIPLFWPVTNRFTQFLALMQRWHKYRHAHRRSAEHQAAAQQLADKLQKILGSQHVVHLKVLGLGDVPHIHDDLYMGPQNTLSILLEDGTGDRYTRSCAMAGGKNTPLGELDSGENVKLCRGAWWGLTSLGYPYKPIHSF